MGKQNVKVSKNDVSRRGVIAAVAAVAAGSALSPSVANAAADDVTKKEAAYFSFEVARYKHDSNSYERVPNKTTAISKDSTSSQYPSAKAIYEFIKVYVGYNYTTQDEGKALGTQEKTGEVTLRDYTVDPYNKDDEYSGLLEESKNPVSGRAVYEQLHRIRSQFTMDEKPTEHSKEPKANYIAKSGGIYSVYQETTAAPSSMDDYEQGLTYSYSGTDVAQDATTPTKKLSWGMKRVDSIYIAISENEAGAFLAANTKYVFKRPTCIWHS